MDYYSQHIIASPKLMAMKLNPIFHNITKKNVWARAHRKKIPYFNVVAVKVINELSEEN